MVSGEGSSQDTEGRTVYNFPATEHGDPLEWGKAGGTESNGLHTQFKRQVASVGESLVKKNRLGLMSFACCYLKLTSSHNILGLASGERRNRWSKQENIRK